MQGMLKKIASAYFYFYKYQHVKHVIKSIFQELINNLFHAFLIHCNCNLVWLANLNLNIVLYCRFAGRHLSLIPCVAPHVTPGKVY